MIIACYAGVGKSTFASMYPEDTLDLYNMPYKWILPEKEGKKGEFENVFRRTVGGTHILAYGEHLWMACPA